MRVALAAAAPAGGTARTGIRLGLGSRVLERVETAKASVQTKHQVGQGFVGIYKNINTVDTNAREEGEEENQQNIMLG